MLAQIPAELMEKQGANTPIEALRQLPSFIGTTATENDSNGGNGKAFITLRGLGPQNVLTLINGRRAFSFSNINAIPISALVRAEILNDGRFGSDAVAGAANFVLLNAPGEIPYEGAEVRVLYGNTTDADAHVRQAYLRGGVSGLDGKVSIAAAGEYYSRANLFSRDREISRSGDLSNDTTGLGLGSFNGNSPTFAGRVSVLPGPIVLPLTGQLVLRNPSENRVTPASYRQFDVPAGTDPSRFNFRAFTPAIPAVEKAMYFVTGRYKIFGDGLQLYGDVMYSKTKQDNGFAPVPFTISSSANGRNEARASLFNPFGNQLGSVRYRLVNELGLRKSFFDQDYWRYVAGINGDFDFKDNSFISHFGYDAGYVYERFDQDRVDSGDARRDYLRALIAPAGYVTAVGVPPLGQPPTGTFNPFIGQNASLIGNAPTYINGVPTGTTAPYNNTIAARPYTDGGAAYIAHSLFFERDYLYDAKISAHLFPNLWNGGVNFAAGYEHRQSQTASVPDPVQLTNQQFGFTPAARFKFLQQVDSLFFGLNVPLITSTMNVPWARSLDLNISWRREEFSASNLLPVAASPLRTSANFINTNPEENFGGSPSVALRYQPFADLTLRASWRQSIRPPTFDELFRPISVSFPVIFGRGPVITLQPPEGTRVGGNPDLIPETTDAYSVGAVWTPKFLPGFAMTLDVYQLYTTNLVLDPDSYAQVLFSTKTIDPDGPLLLGGGPALGITRNPDGTLSTIDSAFGNAGKRLVEGLDVNVVYEIPTERFGKITFSGDWNHFFAWKAGLGVVGFNQNNFLGDYKNAAFPLAPGAIPFNKAFLRGEWEWKGFDFIATGNYIGDYEDDPSFISGNNFSPGERTPPNTSFMLHRRVSSYETLDLQLSYEWKTAVEFAPAYARGSKNVMTTPVNASSATIWQRCFGGHA